MNISLKCFLFTLTLCCSHLILFTQTNIVYALHSAKNDSLLDLLKKDNEDTIKVIHLNTISEIDWHNGSYDSSIAFATTSLNLSQQLDPPFKKGTAKAYNILGNVNREQGNYPKALDFFLRSLAIAEEMKNKSGMATPLGNIGLVYWNQGDYPKALNYYFKALKIDEELGNKTGIARHLGNIGIVYYLQKKYSEALDCYFKALKMDEELGNKNGQARHLGNIGGVYGLQRDYPKALVYYFRALKIKKELGDRNGIAIWLGNIASIYTKQKKYDEAYNYLYRSLTIADSIRSMNVEKDQYQALSTLYEESNIPLHDTLGGKLLNMEQMRMRALYYCKYAVSIRDTLFSEENKKQLVRKELNFEFAKKEAINKGVHDKEIAVSAAEKKRQQVVLILVSFVLILVFIFVGFIFRSLRVARMQKMIIEEKQKEILDSIHYAKRIQTSMLPTDRYISLNLKRLIRN